MCSDAHRKPSNYIKTVRSAHSVNYYTHPTLQPVRSNSLSFFWTCLPLPHTARIAMFWPLMKALVAAMTE